MANEAFIKRATGYEWQKRQDVYVEIDEKEIHSGDFIAITRFDGIDQIIQWGAGSVAGHSTVALWIDGELNVIESQVNLLNSEFSNKIFIGWMVLAKTWYSEKQFLPMGPMG